MMLWKYFQTLPISSHSILSPRPPPLQAFSPPPSGPFLQWETYDAPWITPEYRFQLFPPESLSPKDDPRSISTFPPKSPPVQILKSILENIFDTKLRKIKIFQSTGGGNFLTFGLRFHRFHTSQWCFLKKILLKSRPLRGDFSLKIMKKY